MLGTEITYGHAIISDEARRDVHLKLVREDNLFRWYTEDGVGLEEEGQTVGEAWNALLHDSYHAQWRLRFVQAEE